MAAKSTTQQGIAALKDGNKAEARRLLKRAIQENEKDVTAWLYLSSAVENDRDKTKCLEMVLRLDPENSTAQRGLAKIKANPPQSSALQSSPTIDSLAAQRPPSTSGPADDPYAFDASPEPVPPKKDPQPKAKNGQKPPKIPKNGEKTAGPPTSRRKKWILLGSTAVILLCISCCAFSAFTGKLNLQSSPAQPVEAAEVQVTAATQNLPDPSAPTVTPTAAPFILTTATITPIPTTRPTPTLTPTATYIVLGPNIAKQMSDIQQQVSELRGLPAKTDLTSFIVSKDQAVRLLRSQFITPDTIKQLEDEKRALVILGLIPAGYDLVNTSLYHLMDNIGGFYLPENKQIYIQGLRFGGMEHFVYSHEYDHALIDQAYDLKKIRNCADDAQRCQAVTALIEGDATLLMSQWLHQNASQGDINDLSKYKPPALALAEDSPPTYLVKDVNFPYEQGMQFVKALYDRGKWSEVDNAYSNLPLSTEQILHPQKYTAGEAPKVVWVPAIEKALAGDWKQITSSTLGEWTTYLLLGSGSDEGAQVEDAQAKKAAQGWGGDHYQVYYSPSLDKSALAVHWEWDSEKDHQEFETALTKYLNGRFHNAHKSQPGAACWEENGQTSCFFSQPNRTLWLVAPDLPTLILMWGQYPEFKK